MKISFAALIVLLFSGNIFASESSQKDRLCSAEQVAKRALVTPMVTETLKTYTKQKSQAFKGEVSSSSCIVNPQFKTIELKNFGFDDVPGFQLVYVCNYDYPGLGEVGDLIIIEGVCSKESSLNSPLNVIRISIDPNI